MNAETWPRWDRRTAPEDLAGYIVPAAVAPLGAFPGPSGESRRSRVERIWEELASKRIGYVYAPAGSDEAGQLIRQPGEVLDLPGSGTCIDVALVLAAACEHAGLASKVVVVDPARPGGAAHALVAVLTGQAWPQDWSQEWSLPGGAAGDPLPTGALAQVRASWDSGPPLPVAVLDPVAVTVSMGTSRTVGTDGDLASAVRSGHDYLASGRWRVSLTVAAGGRPDRYTPVQLPLQAPLRELFRDPATTDTVLRLLRPEYALTPFQARDEVTILDDFARRTASGDRTGIMVVTGVGGAGKTRLALEVADRLRVAGWYAGLLRDDLTDPASVSWLASVRAPLFVVVDYADARIAETTRLLSVLQGRQGPPAIGGADRPVHRR